MRSTDIYEGPRSILCEVKVLCQVRYVERRVHTDPAHCVAEQLRTVRLCREIVEHVHRRIVHHTKSLTYIFGG